MNLTENIEILRQQVLLNSFPQLQDVHFLAKRARDDDEDFLDKDSWGRWDSWNDWGAAS